jgi:hypothetical protein
LQAAETELKKERRARVAAEHALAEIQRECKEPFIVPGLLDAFVEITKLTSEVTSEGKNTRS